MKQPRRKLTDLIGSRTLYIKDYDSLVKEIAAYLLTEKRTTDLESLMRDVMQYRAVRGIIEAKAVSAHELTQNVIDDIVSLLRQEYPKAQKVEVDNYLDPHLIGGIRIELPQEQLDLSVEAKLNTFKRLIAAGEE